jgi:hypothetical protein
MALLARAACTAAILLTLGTGVGTGQAPAAQERNEGDYVVRNYTFGSGETLPEVKLHYTTIGTPLRGASGKIRNGVLIMHGSSSPASQVLAASFTAPLVGAGLPLDPAKYFLIFPDLIGVGGSSKPSDGLHARFPKYGYNDMVDLEHRLIADHFGIERLRAVMGIFHGRHAHVDVGRAIPRHDGRALPDFVASDEGGPPQPAVAADPHQRDPHRSGVERRQLHITAARLSEHHADVQHAGAEPGRTRQHTEVVRRRR